MLYFLILYVFSKFMQRLSVITWDKFSKILRIVLAFNSYITISKLKDNAHQIVYL